MNGNQKGNKQGVERGYAIPTELGNFLGAVAGVLSGCLEVFVAKQKQGEATCFTLWLMCVCSTHLVADMKYEAEILLSGVSL